MGRQAVTETSSVAREAMQGLVRGGYSKLRSARFIRFELGGAESARAWLETLPLTSAAEKPRARALNVAITFRGLQRLGLDTTALDGFSEEYRDGMDTLHRQRLLGDHGDSDPATWDWGAAANASTLHGVLLVYAVDCHELTSLTTALEADARAHDVAFKPALETSWLPEFKEHYGFRDGIGQPKMLGMHADAPGRNVVPAGEFVLGYANKYGVITRSPKTESPSPLLPNGVDFGKDGSYLVMRQLEQDVAGFWGFVANAAKEYRFAEHMPDAANAAVALAAKMVGRWPSGAPLVRAPNCDPLPDSAIATDDSFLYASDDPDGMRCPIGSHIRRANPRDWFLSPTPADAMAIADAHRIMRRGRTYGPPLVESMNAAELARAGEAAQGASETGATPRNPVSRGLHFLCLNANISRQFEFIQHTWLNSPKFSELEGGGDPLLGEQVAASSARDIQPAFIVPNRPARVRVTGLQRFVRVRGGAYFFLPSLPALRYLSAL